MKRSTLLYTAVENTIINYIRDAFDLELNSTSVDAKVFVAYLKDQGYAVVPIDAIDTHNEIGPGAVVSGPVIQGRDLNFPGGLRL